MKKRKCPACKRILKEEYRFIGRYASDSVHNCPVRDKVWICPIHGIMAVQHPFSYGLKWYYD